jgi:hypothetical protein
MIPRCIARDAEFGTDRSIRPASTSVLVVEILSWASPSWACGSSL